MPIARDDLESRSRPWQILVAVAKLAHGRQWRLLTAVACTAVGRLAGLVLPASTKYLVDVIVVSKRPRLLVIFVASVTLATGINAAMGVISRRLLTLEAQRVADHLKAKLHEHLLRLTVGFFDSQRVGSLVTRLTADADSIGSVIVRATGVIAGDCVSIVAAIVLISLGNAAAALVAILYLIAFALCLRHAFALLNGLSYQRRSVAAEVSGRVTESLNGVRVIKMLGAHKHEASVFRAGVETLNALDLKASDARARLSILTRVLGMAMEITLLCLCGYRVIEGKATLGELLLLMSVAPFVLSPASNIVTFWTDLTDAAAGLERMNEIFRQEPEEPTPRRCTVLKEVRGDIVIDHVSFGYDPDRLVLSGVSVQAHRGAVIGIVGASGSGKSTLLSLIAGFYSPSGGRITIDGVEVTTLDLASLRRHVGIVFQDTFLFDGTLFDNVAFARPMATRDEIIRACQVATLDTVAAQLARGYDTRVGERGVRLSGGQRQRVAIARTVLADPTVLLLDEATSSLDSASEAEVQQSLSALMRGRTTFVVAHRLSTIQQAPLIVVLDRGAIVERGRHDELMALGGQYWRNYKRQQSSSGFPYDDAEFSTGVDRARGWSARLSEADVPSGMPSIG